MFPVCSQSLFRRLFLLGVSSNLLLFNPIPVMNVTILIALLIRPGNCLSTNISRQHKQPKNHIPQPNPNRHTHQSQLGFLIPKSMDTFQNTFIYTECPKLCIPGCFPRTEILRIRTIQSPLPALIANILRKFMRIRKENHQSLVLLEQSCGARCPSFLIQHPVSNLFQNHEGSFCQRLPFHMLMLLPWLLVISIIILQQVKTDTAICHG